MELKDELKPAPEALLREGFGLRDFQPDPAGVKRGCANVVVDSDWLEFV